ncbi:MAG: Tetratricopeptide repeat [Verrucomicrobia bacterium]|jgi:tetratricopeptide (TPR) repeat protein|nr:Tetratricopeptide repeat [Verrucomicrobiota bacterium]
MTVTEKPALKFSLKIFPWLIVLAALAVYLATANRWVTFGSLPVVGKVLGWDWWSSQVTPPLLYLITLPFTWMPATSAPALMNALAAVLGALTLGTLARTVALLPQDRTREQRQKERTAGGLLSIPTNWIPPLFAAAALGFQMTFWEHATAATGEMLNLLLFAHLIRCLLEYRQDQKESWLWQFSFVYGLATTNNWAMIGFFPFFLIVLVWIRGKSFFKLKFLGKLAAFGLPGLLLYLVMPAIESSRGNGDFLTLLREQLGQQKLTLNSIPKWIPLILSFVVFFPLISMGIRWPSNMGEANPIAAFLTLLMFYLIHAVFLGFSIWVMFDPTYSPRTMALLTGNPFLTFLTFNYLIALSIGYYSGYFLVIFRQSEQRGWKRQSGLSTVLSWLITIIVWIGPVVMAGFLVHRNLPTIRGNNTAAFKEYSQRMASQLPETGAILLSEEPHLILLLEAHYAAAGKNPHLLLDTRYLPEARYQAKLAKHYPDRWTDFVKGKSLPDPLPRPLVAQLINQHARSNQLYYLHPAGGPHILEMYHQQPRGVVYELTAYRPNEAIAPPASAEEQKLNNSFWEEQRDFLNQLQPFSHQPYSDAAVVGRYLSRSLNKWGVALHQTGNTNAAAKFFDDALMMNPQNVVATINKHGKEENPEWTQDRRWIVLLREHGPFCVPELRAELAQSLATHGLLRQSAEQFEYAVRAKPGQISYLLAYSEVLLQAQAPQHALSLLEPVRRSADFAKLPVPTQVEIIRHESRAHLSLKNIRRAEEILLAARQQYPKEDMPLAGLLTVYLAEKKFSQALAIVDQQLALSPDKPVTLMNKGAIYLEMADNPKALALLEQAVKLSPENPAILMNYALAKLRSDDLAAAETNYRKVATLLTNNHAPYFYLGEIAFRQKKNDEAIRHYEKFLATANPASADARQAQQRLKDLKGG